jgi:hypothetical protein
MQLGSDFIAKSAVGAASTMTELGGQYTPPHQRCATCLTRLWTHDGGEPIAVKLVNDFGKY